MLCQNYLLNNNIKNTNWQKYLKEEQFFSDYLHNMQNSPIECRDCCWEQICRGGAYVHRYDTKTDFNNKSVYCEALQYFYSQVTKYLL